jgi:hypothetical protein
MEILLLVKIHCDFYLNSYLLAQPFTYPKFCLNSMYIDQITQSYILK